MVMAYWQFKGNMEKDSLPLQKVSWASDKHVTHLSA